MEDLIERFSDGDDCSKLLVAPERNNSMVHASAGKSAELTSCQIRAKILVIVADAGRACRLGYCSLERTRTFGVVP